MSETKLDIKEPKQGNKFYTVTIQIESENDRGKVKKIKEVHLVEAVSPTEVENKVAKEMEGTMFSWEIAKIEISKIVIVY